MKTNYWKTAMTVLFISGSLSGILFVSCQKEENSVTKSSEIKWEITNKEHQKLIEDVSNYYEESILEALNERNSVLKSSSQSYYIENVIYNKFEEKCLKYNANLKSYNEQILSPDDLQHYMIDLSNKLLSIEEFNDPLEIYTKDYVLNKFNLIFDEFNNSIANSNILSEEQKQIIIENAVIRFNILFITLEYGEQISGEDNLKSISSWLKKNKKKIECTTKSMTAAAACTSAAVSTVSGPASIALWVVCTAQTMNAAACWAEI